VTPVRIRPLAETDLVERTRSYRREGGDVLAERFFEAAIGALDAIGRMPGVGSLQAEALSGVAGLRMRRIPGFPCGWFYLVLDDSVDVVRLLADSQDLPMLVAEATPE
jgi:toxin ParE1/3/4